MKRPRRKLWVLAICFFVFAAVPASLSLAKPGSTGIVENFFLTVARPWHRLVGAFERGWNGMRSFLASHRALRESVRLLEKENRQLHEARSRLGMLQAENAALRAALGEQRDPREPRRLVARIVGKGVPFGQEIIVDRGSNDGVERGDATLSGRSALLGMVWEVFPAQARVRLVTHRRFRASAITAERRVEGLARGGAGRELALDLVGQSTVLMEGETVATSGFDGLFAPGLVIGVISAVTANPTDLFLRVRLRPAADLAATETVTLIHAPGRSAKE